MAPLPRQEVVISSKVGYTLVPRDPDEDRLAAPVRRLRINGGAQIAADYRDRVGRVHRVEERYVKAAKLPLKGASAEDVEAICELAHAGEQGLARVFLGTTAKFLAAHRFYEKNGFALIDAADLPESFPRMNVDTRFYRIDL